MLFRSHGRHARAALAAGKHVFVEKPLATTLKEVEAIANAASIATTKTMVDFHNRVSPPIVAVQQAVAMEPRLEKVDASAAQGTLRYVQRSEVMAFPDTINIKVAPMADGGSAVLIYSRSQIGKGDMGVNLARVKRWAELIGKVAGKGSP